MQETAVLQDMLKSCWHAAVDGIEVNGVHLLEANCSMYSSRLNFIKESGLEAGQGHLWEGRDFDEVRPAGRISTFVTVQRLSGFEL